MNETPKPRLASPSGTTHTSSSDDACNRIELAGPILLPNEKGGPKTALSLSNRQRPDRLLLDGDDDAGTDGAAAFADG
ncbi:hypothetical protein, partial [Mesorhizobium sp.]|uniref:hypothetical protein n=1 Tax=Mesorhizobium sp. TaxID=1871066 RepID=UPI0025B96517